MFHENLSSNASAWSVALKHATHYPVGLSTQAYSKSKFMKFTPWSLEEGPSESVEERRSHPIVALKMTSVGTLCIRPSG